MVRASEEERFGGTRDRHPIKKSISIEAEEQYSKGLCA